MDGFMVIVKTDNTAYQALVLVWLGCGKKDRIELIFQQRKKKNKNDKKALLIFTHN